MKRKFPKFSIGCQYLFFSLFMVLMLHQPLFGYSSAVLKKGRPEKINFYYAKNLEKLKRSIKPRFIHLIDTRNYARHHNLMSSGVLFTIKNYQAREIDFVSNIDRFQKHKMIRNEKGVWYYLLPINEYKEKSPNRTIYYKFVVDGLFVQDSTHDNQEDDNAGGSISKFSLTGEMFKPQEGVIVLNSVTPNSKKVVFRIYAPNARYITLLGSFNNWDSEIDSMKKRSDGYFEIEKDLTAGEYTYLFRIDGELILDKNCSELRYHPVFKKVDYFKVK